MNSDQALKKLKEGNQHFVSDQTIAPRRNSLSRKGQITQQAPFCAILTCSDSRIPVEIIFDQGIGDLFVVRLAGNVASKTATESLYYAASELKIPLIVVMGHQNCGAISAMINPLTTQTAEKNLEETASLIKPCINHSQSIKEAVIANVQRQTTLLKNKLPDLTICGAYYDFETGLVTFL